MSSAIIILTHAPLMQTVGLLSVLALDGSVDPAKDLGLDPPSQRH